MLHPLDSKRRLRKSSLCVKSYMIITHNDGGNSGNGTYATCTAGIHPAAIRKNEAENQGIPDCHWTVFQLLIYKLQLAADLPLLRLSALVRVMKKYSQTVESWIGPYKVMS
jgi:hypothetical protein